MISTSVSIVTPTFRRPNEVKGLLENLARQTILPVEVILIDGATDDDIATQEVVASMKENFSFAVVYIRQCGGTAIQRNFGVERATGDYISFIDDDVRLEPDFLENILRIFDEDKNSEVGGIVGYRTNEFFDSSESERWRWYKRLKLLSVYEPGRYDFKSGYPINTSMQPPFEGTREVDFMTTACAVWRREVLDSGLRFDEFFQDYGTLEDAHFSLRAGRSWKLLQCGNARCEELRSPHGRPDRRRIGYKSVANYHFVFREVSGPLTLGHQYRFWRFQGFELFRIGISAIRRRRWNDVSELVGKFEGMLSVARRPRTGARGTARKVQDPSPS